MYSICLVIFVCDFIERKVFLVLYMSYLVVTSSSAIKESDKKSSMNFDNKEPIPIREHAVEEVASRQGHEGSSKVNKQ